MSVSIEVQWACGCRITLGSVDEARECPTHHVSRAVHVTAPAPRFVGTASGPYVTTTELEPYKGQFNA